MPHRFTRREMLQRGVALASLMAASRVVSGQEQAIDPRSDFDETYTAQVDKAIESGLQYLMGREKDGQFPTARWGQNIGICSLAGLAFLSRGSRIDDRADGELVGRLARRIQSLGQSNGFIFDDMSRSHGPMYEHAFATLFLSEVQGTAADADFRNTIKSAVELIVLSQNEQGGWRYDPRPSEADVSVTVSQIMALRAAKNGGFFVPEETVTRAIDYLRRAQNPDGGFTYQLDGGPSRYALTAGALVAMYNSGVNEGKELDQAFEFLIADRDMDRYLQTNYYFYAHYYSAQAFWHRGGSMWNSWYRRLTNSILPLQLPDGSWMDQSQGTEYATAMACLILNTPRSLLPIYQR